MNDIASVRKSVDIMESAGVEYALLHTTNIYPTPPNLVRLEAMLEIKKNFKDDEAMFFYLDQLRDFLNQGNEFQIADVEKTASEYD